MTERRTAIATTGGSSIVVVVVALAVAAASAWLLRLRRHRRRRSPSLPQLQPPPTNSSSSSSSVSSELRGEFDHAVVLMRSRGTSWSMSNRTKLRLYALYKQATVGECPAGSSRPSAWDVVARAKWDAWNSLTCTREEAMARYVKMVKDANDGYAKDRSNGDDNDNDENEYEQEEEEEEEDYPDAAKSFGVAVSSMARHHDDDEESLAEEDRDVFYWCQEGNVEKVKERLGGMSNINDQDGFGMGLLHWACDRGHEKMVAFLLEQGANPLARSEDGYPSLYYAFECDHARIAQLLIDAGADIHQRIELADRPPPTTLRDIASKELLEQLSLG